MKRVVTSALLLFLVACLTASVWAAEYSWQEPKAKVLPTGDMEWMPQPFAFEAGGQVRYIDYENGDDSADGRTMTTAWKHHPWDTTAKGNAANASGVVTYVFRRGVDYRGNLVADDSGEPGNPIRLIASARDADSEFYWGEGQARILGSTRMPSEWVKASSVEHPERLPEPEKVWAIDLGAQGMLNEDGKLLQRHRKHWKDSIRMPYVGFFVMDEDGTSHTQHNARTPDWQPGNANFVLDYWHAMDGNKWLKKNGRNIAKGLYDEDVLKGHPADYFEGGFIWPQYGHFMGGPMPRYIGKEKKKRGVTFPHYDPEKGVIYEGCYGLWAEGLRYMIENLPQLLDTAGEFYFDKETGHFFYRPEEGQDPNEMRLELSSIANGVVIQNQKHIVVSGLSFRYQTTNGVALENNVEHITVENCRFEDILEFGVRHGFGNWRVQPEPEFATEMRITDCDFQNMWTGCIQIGGRQARDKVVGHVDVLRNNVYNNGMRDKGNVQSAVPALSIKDFDTGEIAGNILQRCFGSGIMVTGSRGGNTDAARDYPLCRILIYHNKTVDTALGVNDYGGMSLWQGGSIYCYNNNIGNSPGFMPAGITMFGGGREMNLSYPLYLDGAYKIFSFNNIVWARSNETRQHKYATRTPGYFMVFGFLNQLTNNTFYRHGSGVGGSSGHRNDVLGNVFSDIKKAFIAHDRSGDPSLVGGGDDGSSGRRGVPTLAYANNVFYGEAHAGRLLRPNEPAGYPDGIEADTVEQLRKMMKDFPIRYGELGERTQQNPLVGGPEPIEDIGLVDFRLREGSAAIDSGVQYFVPWSLYATVGEWHFTENQADPTSVMDYSWYMSKAHYNRMMYEFIPTFDLKLNAASLDDYAEAPSEDWANGAMTFDGERFGVVTDLSMREDITLAITYRNRKGDIKKRRVPNVEWEAPEPVSGEGNRVKYAEDAVMRFPGEKRHTLIFRTENLLTEANIKTEPGHTGGGLLGKHDGESGYRLFINDAGKAQLDINSGGATASVASAEAVNDGQWHHVLAEVDRESGRMTMYVDGEKSSETNASFSADASLENKANFLVGKTDNDRYFVGAVDFMRVCQGTLADARTSIGELYQWQTDGPWRYDMAGNRPVGRRDAGALEYTQ